MPANTPNRNYPYPLDADSLAVPADMHALAAAVDADTENLDNAILTEQASRITQDTAILNEYHGQRPQMWIQGTHYDGKLAIDGGYVEATLDMFAVHVLEFNTTFVAPPAVIVTTAASTQTITVGVEHTTTTTANVFGRLDATGDPAFFYVVAYYYLAVGILP